MKPLENKGRATEDSNLCPTAPEASRIGEIGPKFADRDGAVTAIRRALEFVAAKDPLAMPAALHAMELALGVLLADENKREASG